MLLPFISKLYCSITLKQKVYGLVLLLVIPTFIYDGSKLLGIWVPNPSFVVFWPDLGIFLLGRDFVGVAGQVETETEVVICIAIFDGFDDYNLGHNICF